MPSPHDTCLLRPQLPEPRPTSCAWAGEVHCHFHRPLPPCRPVGCCGSSPAHDRKNHATQTREVSCRSETTGKKVPQVQSHPYKQRACHQLPPSKEQGTRCARNYFAGNERLRFINERIGWRGTLLPSNLPCLTTTIPLCSPEERQPRNGVSVTRHDRTKTMRGLVYLSFSPLISDICFPQTPPPGISPRLGTVFNCSSQKHTDTWPSTGKDEVFSGTVSTPIMAEAGWDKRG